MSEKPPVISEQEQEKAHKKLVEKTQGYVKQRFDLKATSFILPKDPNVRAQNRDRVISLTDTSDDTKVLIFQALYTAYYQAFIENSQPKSRKSLMHDQLPNFMDYLNDVTIDNNYKVLKDYEAYRTRQGVKPQSTGMPLIRTLLVSALKFTKFISVLNQSQHGLLKKLAKTKLAPPDAPEQNTLTQWFSEMSWLREPQYGMGNDLYNRLASPKLLIQSMELTTATALLELHKAKYALIHWFQQRNVQPDDIPVAEVMTGDCHPDKRRVASHQWLQALATHHNALSELEQKALAPAVELIIHSYANLSYDLESELVSRFSSGLQSIHYSKKQQKMITGSPASQWMFDGAFVHALLRYAHAPDKAPVPCCGAEHFLFQWLMAIQAVQPSDIAKLTCRDFRFLERHSGTVESIECAYFKGRADGVRQTPSLNPKELGGKAVLSFIHDRTAQRQQGLDAPISVIDKPNFSLGKTGDFGRLVRWMQHGSMKPVLDKVLQTHKASEVFLSGLYAVIRFGLDKHKQKNQAAKTLTNTYVFGYVHIKNSAVHSRSDNYDPSQLVNYNSHTNDTERQSYLTEENQEWVNNCGRITRAVMLDLQVNVFETDEHRIRYHSDFTRAANDIQQRRDEVLARMKVVTKKDSGSIKEAVINENAVSTLRAADDAPADTLVVLDCPESVMRIKHYLAQAEKHHHQIAKNAPEYLFYEVLPTVEWMEIVLLNKYFSSDSIQRGETMYDTYKAHLPPLFTAQIGGA